MLVGGVFGHNDAVDTTKRRSVCQYSQIYRRRAVPIHDAQRNIDIRHDTMHASDLEVAESDMQPPQPNCEAGSLCLSHPATVEMFCSPASVQRQDKLVEILRVAPARNFATAPSEQTDDQEQDDNSREPLHRSARLMGYGAKGLIHPIECRDEIRSAV